MKIVRKKKILINLIKDFKKNNERIGFVPTMGALHQGHISLLEKSNLENTITICSIYINPTQFNSKQDLIKYPRQELKDIEILRATKCTLVFIPEDTEMYSNNIASLEYDFTDCLDKLEGLKRPGHFSGVITIVQKLFNLVQPHNAYFGEKDFQQLWLIKKFIQHQSLPIKIIPCETIRDKNGLALSSRNRRLNDLEKEYSTLIFKCIFNLNKSIKELFIDPLNQIITKQQIITLKTYSIQPLLDNPIIKLDYFEIVDTENFSFANYINKQKKYRILIAVYVGKIRLIDNISIN